MIEGLRTWLAQPPDEAEQNLRRLRAAFKHLPVLEGARLRLRPPVMEDAADLYSYARDEENCRYVLWERHRSPFDSREALRHIIWQNKRGLPASFAIEWMAEARMVGTIGFQTVDTARMSAEVGYTLARRLWNRGLATEALELLLQYAFDDLGFQCIEASYDILNPASGAVMRKAGMREAGIRERSLSIKGRMADMMHCAITLKEWQQR